MKKIAVISAISLAFVGCSNEILVDEVKNVDSPIDFSVFADNATKAQTNNKTNLDFFYTTFNVYGWKSTDGKANWTPVFDDVTNEYFASNEKGSVVYKNDDQKPGDEWNFSAGWYYENVRYWDKFATDYLFSAYTPTSSEVACSTDGKILIGSSNSKVTVETTNLMATPAKELAYTGFNKDYMIASATAKASPVNLVFAHKLTKFDVKIKLNSSKVNTKQAVTIKEVTIKNMNGTSYYDSSNDKSGVTGFLSGWATPETEISYSTTTPYQLNGTTEGTDKFDGYFIMESLMIPQSLSKASTPAQLDELNEACVYVKYSVGSEDFEGHYALANLFLAENSTETKYDFLGGNEYILTINVGPDPIYFTASVTAWVENEATLEAN